MTVVARVQLVYNDSTDSTSQYNDSSVVMMMFGYVVVTTGGFMAQSMVTSGSILGCSTSHCLSSGEMDL